VLELPQGEIGLVLGKDSYNGIHKLRIINLLRDTPAETALICRAEFKDSHSNIQHVFEDDVSTEILLLEQISQVSALYYIKRRWDDSKEIKIRTGEGHFVTPCEIDNNRASMTFIGNLGQLKGTLKLLDGIGVKYRVASLIDARFPRNSPLGQLTYRQFQILAKAYNLGFYDIERKIGLEDLARKLRITVPTINRQLRWAEMKLLGELFNQRQVE